MKTMKDIEKERISLISYMMTHISDDIDINLYNMENDSEGHNSYRMEIINNTVKGRRRNANKRRNTTRDTFK
jgi:hypothetical protein